MCTRDINFKTRHDFQSILKYRQVIQMYLIKKILIYRSKCK